MNNSKLEHINHLHDNHYKLPGQYKQTMTLQNLQETMLYTTGFVMANGEMWKVAYERLCPSVYQVWLEK